MKRKILCVLVAALSALCFTACSDDLGTIDGHKYPETLRVRMISSSIIGDNGQEIGNASKDSVVRFMEEKFNVKFEFLYVPSPTQEEVYNKINMMAVTNDLPDIIVAGKDKIISSNVYSALIDNGSIVNAKEFVDADAERYPVLHQVLAQPDVNTQEYCDEDGELYMIPRYFGTVDHGFVLRKDWIDSYNDGKIPTDYLELEEMLTRFKNAKPAGVDQIGLSLPSTWWLGHFYSGFVDGNTWEKGDDGYQYLMETDGQKEAFTYLNRLYASDLMDKDVISGKGSEKETVAKFVAGRTGAMMMGVTYARQLLMEQKFDPDVELCYVSLDGSKGPMLNYMTDYFEGCVVRKNFKDVPRLFDMIEYILSPEGDMVMKYGLEGTHYTMDGDKIVVNTEIRKKEGWASGRHPISKMFNIEVQSFLDESFAPDYAKLKSYIDSLSVPGARYRNPVAGIVTQAERNTNGAYLDKVSTYSLKFITGGYSIDGRWNEFKTELNASGIAAITSELNAKYL